LKLPWLATKLPNTSTIPKLCKGRLSKLNKKLNHNKGKYSFELEREENVKHKPSTLVTLLPNCNRNGEMENV